MQDPQAGLIEVINRIVGGAGVTLIAAFVGRAMYHAGEVRAKRRPMFSKDLIWEVPIAVGMALIGEGVASQLALSETSGTALIAVIAYLGPRSIGVIIESALGLRKNGG